MYACVFMSRSFAKSDPYSDFSVLLLPLVILRQSLFLSILKLILRYRLITDAHSHTIEKKEDRSRQIPIS